MIFVLYSSSPGAGFTGSVTHMEKTSAKSNYKTSATALTKISIQFTKRIYFCSLSLQCLELSLQNKMLSHRHLHESEFVCTHPKATPVKIPQEDSTFLTFFLDWEGKRGDSRGGGGVVIGKEPPLSAMLHLYPASSFRNFVIIKIWGQNARKVAAKEGRRKPVKHEQIWHQHDGFSST